MTDESPSAPQQDNSEDIEVEIAPLQVLPPVVPVTPVTAPTGSSSGPQSARVSPPSSVGDEPATEAVEPDRTERAAPRKPSLRVPDDEVRRSSDSPPSFRSSSHAPAGAMTPMRIISIGQAPSLNAGISPKSVLPSVPESPGAAPSHPTLLRRSSPSHPEGKLEAPASAATGALHVPRSVRTFTEAAPEDSWTPYQPTVADRAPAPVSNLQPPAAGAPAVPAVAPSFAPPPPPTVPASPLGLRAASPMPSIEIPISDSAPAPPPDPTPSDDLIQVDTDVELPPSSVRDVRERKSDPGDAPEITTDDLVSVENVAAAAAAVSDALSARSKGISIPPPPPPASGVGAPSAVSGLPPMRPKQNTAPNILIPPSSGIPAVPMATASPKPPLVIVPPHIGMTPPTVDRKKPRLWWDDMFGDDLLRTMVDFKDADILKEVDFIEDSLGIAKGGSLLDLGCGAGRHAVELSRRGYEVVGLDLSLGMLAQASDSAQQRGEKLNFVQGDMREMTFDAMFDGVYCWNTTFGYFEEEKNALAVNRVHKALKKGGQFLLDVINRDYVVRQAPSLAWFEGDGCVCMDEMQIDWITSRMRVKRTMMLDDGRTKEVEYSIRVYSLHELGRILHEQGFRVCEVSGRITTPGVFFGNESPRTLILAEKR